MGVKDLLTALSDRVAAETSVQRVYGEPVRLADRIVIPVAEIGYGFGAGMGRGDQEQEGGGGGGGGRASAAGALEITADGARFVEFAPHRKLATAALFGFAVGALFALVARR